MAETEMVFRGERLKGLRLERELTQADVGAVLDVAAPQGYIGALESGRKQPGLKFLRDLARFFGTSTDYLLGMTDSNLPADKEESNNFIFLRVKYPEQRITLQRILDIMNTQPVNEQEFALTLVQKLYAKEQPVPPVADEVDARIAYLLGLVRDTVGVDLASEIEARFRVSL